ncbi:MAG: thioesterase family protein [Cytophagales bacterium]|nr:thioesterase family protein [Cytophagales bacterium]
MYQHNISLRVRYAETDQMGYVYHGVYATYFEVARVEALRNIGVSYKDLEKTGISMPVRELSCQYLRPIAYDDLINIHTKIPAEPTARLLFKYEITDHTGNLISRAESLLFFWDQKRKKPTQPPKMLSQALKPYFQNAKPE